MNRTNWLVPAILLSVVLSAHAQGVGKGKREPIDPAGIARLVADSGGNAQVTVTTPRAPLASSARRPARSSAFSEQAARAVSDDAKKSRAAEFLDEPTAASSASPTSPRELERGRASPRTGRAGRTSPTKQVYRGVPVFAGELQIPLRCLGRARRPSTAPSCPSIARRPQSPTRSAEEAGKTAVAKVRGRPRAARPSSSAAETDAARLPRGPGQGRRRRRTTWRGRSRSADGVDVREFVYVDAHTRQVHRPDHRHPRRQDPPRLRRRGRHGAGAQLPGNAVLGRRRRLPDRHHRSRQHDPGLGGDLRPVLDRLRPRLLRRRRRDHGLDLQSRQRLSERVVERDLHLVLPGHHHRRRHRPRVGPRLHRSTPHNLIYAVAAGRAQRVVLRHLGRDGRPPQRPRRRHAGRAAHGERLHGVHAARRPTVTINTPAAIAGVKAAGTAAFGPDARSP